MFRSAADRRVSKRRKSAARWMMPNSFERHGFDRCNFRKAGYAGNLRRSNKLKNELFDRCRAEHARHDLRELDLSAADERAEAVELADAEYERLYEYERESYYSYLDDREETGVDQAWSIYHEYISVEAHNYALYDRFPLMDVEYPKAG